MQFLYQKFIQSLPIESHQYYDGRVHLFNKFELLKLKGIYIQTLWMTAITGGACFVGYYIPTYIFEDFFLQRIPLNIWGFSFELGLPELIWCGILTVVEIIILTLIHIRMTHKISNISGLLRPDNKEAVLNDVLRLGLGRKDKTAISYGINPIKNVSKFYLFTINTLNIFKAFLSNQLLRFLLRQFMARYLFKYFLDLIGTPIYMVFNALATHFVYRNIISTIMGRQIIQIYISSQAKAALNEEEKELIYDALHLVVVSKKAFNYNHAALIKAVLEYFEIEPVKEHLFKEDDLLKLRSFRQEVQKLVLDIIILGYVLDGKISNREKKQIESLNEKYEVNLSIDRLIENTKAFMKGKGVELVGIK